MLTKINTTTPGLIASPAGTPNSSKVAYRSSWAETDSSLNEDEPTDDDDESQEWGLTKGMELFEISAMEDTGKLGSRLHLNCSNC